MRIQPVLFLGVLVAPLGAQAPRGGTPVPAAVAAVEQLDALRSGLAAALEGRTDPPDEATFAQVCRPVGQQARALASSRGWQVVQMAERNRNRANALDEEGRRATRRFEAEPDLMAFWIRTALGGTPGARYFRRITVEQSCLACHGAMEGRPAFVRDQYPADRAFGFMPGELRGVYAVFVPDSLTGKD